MALTLDDGTFIPLAQARQMVTNYQNNPAPDPNNVIKAHYFGKNKLLEVINQSNAIGARIYHGKSDNGSGTMIQHVIFVGVDSQENDILNTNKILEFSKTCPPDCAEKGKGL